MAFDDYEITNRPMTSDEVFASLVDFQRDEFGNLLLGEATRETSVRELFNTFEAGTRADGQASKPRDSSPLGQGRTRDL